MLAVVGGDRQPELAQCVAARTESAAADFERQIGPFLESQVRDRLENGRVGPVTAVRPAIDGVGLGFITPLIAALIGNPPCEYKAVAFCSATGDGGSSGLELERPGPVAIGRSVVDRGPPIETPGVPPAREKPTNEIEPPPSLTVLPVKGTRHAEIAVRFATAVTVRDDRVARPAPGQVRRGCP